MVTDADSLRGKRFAPGVDDEFEVRFAAKAGKRPITVAFQDQNFALEGVTGI